MKRSAIFVAGAAGLLTLGLWSGAAVADGGYLGVYLRTSPEGDSKGALVEEVVPGSPAEKAGLRSGDRIVGAGGKDVATPEDLRKAIESAAPDSTLELRVARGSETIELAATLAAPAAEEPAVPEESAHGTKPEETRGFLGVGCAPIHPAVAAHLGIPEGIGVSVMDTWEGSPARAAGLRANDILLSIDGKEFRGPDEFVATLSGKKPGDKVRLGVVQGGTRKDLEVVLAERPPEAVSARPLGLRRGAPGMPAMPSLPGMPDFGHRGSLILRGPDGREHRFQFPDGSWDSDSFLGELEKQFQDEWKAGPGADIRGRVEKLLDTLRAGGPGNWSSSSAKSSSVARVVEDGLDITVRDEDGVRTVDVKKGEETIAKDLPWDQLGKLPEDVRARVEKVGESVKVKVEVTPPESRPLERQTGGKELRA